MFTSIAQFPLRFVQLLGPAKSFKKNPLLGNPTLNRIGLHVLRVALAQAMTQIRWRLLGSLMSADDKRQFHTTGYLLKEDFLPQELFDALKAEARSFHGRGIEQTQGDTQTQHVHLDEVGLRDLPACQAVVEHRPLCRLLQYTGSHLSMPDLFLQRIRNGFVEAEPDPQKTLHSDTFHPTMKAWLFIDDVPIDKGPFTYVPGSHKLSLKRLRWEYRQSLMARTSPNNHHANGSFRVAQEDLHELGLPDPQGIAVRENTLVIANTHGFHCRGQSTGQSTRLELWAFSRKNPFNPLPGLGSRAFDRTKARIRWQIRMRHEARQIAAGKEPIWRSTMLDFRDDRTENSRTALG
jgi:hypothetical protein